MSVVAVVEAGVLPDLQLLATPAARTRADRQAAHLLTVGRLKLAALGQAVGAVEVHGRAANFAHDGWASQSLNCSCQAVCAAWSSPMTSPWQAPQR
jgi:hypothetical protein